MSQQFTAPVNLRVLGLASEPTYDPTTVLWLKSYDPEAHDGRGAVELTPEREEAITFASATAAHELWRAIPHCNPVRPDGQPNRPLTAYHTEIVAVGTEPVVL